jgi:hypothetical protein
LFLFFWWVNVKYNLIIEWIWDYYGKAFGVSKITDLTNSTYDEDVQFVVEPKFFKGIKGAHTYSCKDMDNIVSMISK